MFSLACIHLVLLLWFPGGIAYSAEGFIRFSSRLNWLRFNGDFLVMTAILLIAIGIISVMAFELFEVTGISIKSFYAENIAFWGAVAIPLTPT